MLIEKMDLTGIEFPKEQKMWTEVIENSRSQWSINSGMALYMQKTEMNKIY